MVDGFSVPLRRIIIAGSQCTFQDIVFSGDQVINEDMRISQEVGRHWAVPRGHFYQRRAMESIAFLHSREIYHPPTHLPTQPASQPLWWGPLPGAVGNTR